MKLVRLRLQNYRRHHDTTIEWPDGVTAILGANGSGKSTLIEAIGFALFGSPATRTPRAKELLRFDQAAPSDPVRVVLDMELGGQAIRVRRELRGTNLTPSASLEVDGVVLVPPGAGSGTAVTDDLQRRLGMDREAFYTTVIAQQKDLGRLAGLTKTERKKLILDMMGVDRIDRAIALARQQRRQTEGRLQEVEGLLAEPATLREQAKDAQKRLTEAQTQHNTATKSWQDAKATLEAAGKELAIRETEATTHQRLEENLRNATRDLEEARKHLETIHKQLAEAEAAHTRIDQLKPLAKQLPTAEKALQEATTQHEAARQRQAAEADLEKRRRQLKDGQQSLANLPKPPSLPPPDPAPLEEARTTLVQAEKDHAVAQAKLHDLQQRHTRLSKLGADAPCPTCEQPLRDHLPSTLTHISEEQQTAKHEAARLAQAVEAARRNVDQLAKAHKEAEAAREQERQHEAERTNLTTRLEALQRTIQDLEARLPTIPDALPDVHALQQQVNQARQAYEEQLRQEALANQRENLAKQAAAAATQQQETQTRHEAATQALQTSPHDPANLQKARNAKALAEQSEREAERAVHAATQSVQAAEAAHQRIQEKQAEDKKRRDRSRTLREEAQYWAALAGHTGRGGLLDRFRDHLVERLGPAIQEEACHLIARFTDGRYNHIILDEGYEVYVEDQGTPYTLDRFSGGESDLVHLALRLAVSRLLASRSGGAEVRFLALDEVFGSLDRQRRDLVAAALQGLSGIYSQVLVVTHLDALQDALDNAILVEDVDGSSRVSMHKG